MFFLLLMKYVRGIYVFETFNNNLIFVDETVNEQWSFSISSMVDEYDNRGVGMGVLGSNSELAYLMKNEIDHNITDHASDSSISAKKEENYGNVGDAGMLTGNKGELNTLVRKTEIINANDEMKDIADQNNEDDTDVRSNTPSILMKATNTLSKIEDYTDGKVCAKIKEKIDSFGFTETGKIYCIENKCIMYLAPRLSDIINQPFLYKNVLITASKRNISYDIRTSGTTLYVIIGVLYVRLMDVNSRYTRILKFYNICAPFFSVEKGVKVLYDVFEDGPNRFTVYEPIKNVYKLENFKKAYFFRKILREAPDMNDRVCTDLKILAILMTTVFIVVLFLRRENHVKVKRVLRVDKGVKYASGVFNRRNVLVKIHNKKDIRYCNELHIMKMLDMPCFIKYTYREERKHEFLLVVEDCGKSLQERIDEEAKVLPNSTNHSITHDNTFTISETVSNEANTRNDDAELGDDALYEQDASNTYASVHSPGVSEFESTVRHTKADTCKFSENVKDWLSLFLKLVRVVHELHAKNIAHCNLTFVNIFVKNDEVFIGNFEECFFDQEHVQTSRTNDESHVANIVNTNDNLVDNEHTDNTENVSNGYKKRIEGYVDVLRYPNEHKLEFGLGTENFRAPEIIRYNSFDEPLDMEKCKKADVFSLAVMLHTTVFGHHPFNKDNYAIEDNVVHDNYSLNSNVKGPLLDLMHHMLKNDYKERLGIGSVERHPAFWDNEKTYNFYATLSDILENKSDTSYKIFCRLERNKSKVFAGNWANMLDKVIRDELIMHRIYNFNGLKGLLRVIRNKGRHYQELASEIRHIYKSFPDGFVEYFKVRFPNLLMVCYYSGKVAATEELLRNFYR
ncbi:IRE protein kinase [Vavraia culicis subsp. floridensis]|uniref:IRE protein kinase n=1 Tax=Vavraia culicis (isolate floridensis) TaxID=948595 RepID=L2GTS4_VAVCU|nr:IRE protein kinase [Vavraia culicis subsp. floridensis]ELA47066.1 IRE protein kinase [Vavraia culicis subsp. floridensis]